jgi:hypothetical protein
MEFSKSILVDMAYGYEPMTRTLAEAIKELRCERDFRLQDIPWGLNNGFGHDFTLGKELCEKAKAFLNDSDPRW